MDFPEYYSSKFKSTIAFMVVKHVSYYPFSAIVDTIISITTSVSIM